MGAYVLIGGLWAAVFVYWLWTRRPTTADTVGLFRRELGVLRTASPQTVSPANRLDPNRPVLGARLSVGQARPAGLNSPLAAAALSHRRMEMHRRRRDIVCVLAATAALCLLLAVLTGSALVMALQVVCDLALGGYVALLFKAAVAHSAYPAARARYAPRAPGREVATGTPARPVPASERYDDTDYFASAVLTGVERPPLASRMARRAAAPTRRAPVPSQSAPRPAPPQVGSRSTRPVGRHSAVARAEVDYDLTFETPGMDAGAYGDFDDYEALAIAN